MVVFAGALLSGACGSVEPEVRPQPAARARPSEPSPPPAAVPVERALALDEFAAAVAAAWRRDPAPVAVLPAFTPDPLHPRGTRVFATDAGEWLAEKAIAALAAAAPDLEVWAPEAVVAELARANRSLRDVHATDDVLPLLARTDAGYVVYGSVEKVVVGGRLSGRTEVQVRLTCARPGDGTLVASRQATLTDPPVVRELSARLERAGATLVGARAPAFTPSLDAEVRIAAQQALAALLAANRAVFAGRRCLVQVEGGASDPARALAALVGSTLRERLARAFAGADRVTVLAGGPPADGDVVLSATLRPTVQGCALILFAERRGGAESAGTSVPIDPRFDAELRRIL